jgi:hypothetical protein
MSENIRKAAARVKAARAAQDKALKALKVGFPETPEGNNAYREALKAHDEARLLVHDEEKYLATLVIAEMERTS